MTSDLKTRVVDGTLWITFDRPEVRNAMTLAMYDGLAAACSAVPSDGSVKAVVINGSGGKAFAAGTDMTEFRGFATSEDALNYEARMAGVMQAVETCAVPTIAALNGACTGGGAVIAASCDIRLASTTLKFGVPIARTLGNCLSAANLARLTSLLGAGRVRELIFTARLMGADEALAAGLVTEVLADDQVLLERASALAEQVGSMAPLTLRATKEAMRRNREAAAVEDHDLVTLCYMSSDFKNGLDAFLSGRKPAWQGR
ncbi:MAG: enoyl-CoA hydratase/isomerase family protein [Pseudomonadota bacterium]